VKLTEQHLESLVALIAPPDRRAEFAERIRNRPLDEWIVLLDDDVEDRGEVCAAILVDRRSADFPQLWRLYVRAGTHCDVGVRTVAEAVADVRSRGARRVRTRVLEKHRTDDYESALRSAGFVAGGMRVEFKTPLEELPLEGETPFVWRTLGDSKDDVAEAARMLDAVSVGDPDSSDDEDATEFIQEHLGDSGTEVRMQIGSIDGGESRKDAAFLLAEVAPKTGWSTLSYFGIKPEFRGRGLGVVAHRHGIATLRAMGGKLYHGGCWVENAAMVRTFEANGCREFARMRDWQVVFGGAGD